MRYYRTITKVNHIEPGEIIELPDSDASELLAAGAIEETNADHLIERHGADGKVSAALQKAMEDVRRTIDSVKGKIADLDGKLKMLNNERASLLSAPLHKEDAIALLKADIERQREEFKEPYSKELIRIMQSRNIGLAMNRSALGDLRAPYPTTQNMPMFSFAQMFSLLMPDRLEAVFREVLDQAEWDESAPRLDYVRNRVAVIEQEMAGLQANRNALAEQLSDLAVA